MLVNLETMKKVVTIIIITLVLQTEISAQCGINYQKYLDKYCQGKYLIHQELDNMSASGVSLILEKDNRYAVYLLNPSHSIPSLKLEGSGNLAFKDVETKYDRKENYYAYVFTVEETGKYAISLDFGTEDKACVLIAIYLQNDTLFNTGIYKSYRELKENKPSIEFNYQISAKMRGYGILNASGQIPYYRLDIEKEQCNSIGRILAFSDGRNLYINEDNPKISPKTEFVRTEYLGRYLYFEERGSTMIFIGNVPSTSYFPDQKILDINTGVVIDLNKKTLQAIIADDIELLDQFKSDPNKVKNLKEYLIKYLERQNQNSRI